MKQSADVDAAISAEKPLGVDGVVGNEAVSAEFKVLHLFSGRCGLPGGFDIAVRACGGVVDMVDLIVSKELDLCDDYVFEGYLGKVRSRTYAAVFMTPPSGTFRTAAAPGCAGGHGHGVLRGRGAPDIYGVRGLRGRHQEKVRAGTLCALRCAAVADVCMECDVARLRAQLDLGGDAPRVVDLPEVARALGRDGVFGARLGQCAFGGAFRKPAAFMGSLELAGARCVHEARHHWEPWSAESFAAFPESLNGHVAERVAAAVGRGGGGAMALRRPRPARNGQGRTVREQMLRDVASRALRDNASPEPAHAAFENTSRGARSNPKEARRQEDADCLGGVA